MASRKNRTNATPVNTNADETAGLEAALAEANAEAAGDGAGEGRRVVSGGGEALRPSLVTADTRGVLVLFPYTPREPKPGVVYPTHKGNLDMQHGRVSVSGFASMTDEGRAYLSLSIGEQGGERVHGAMFRAEEQDQSNGRWHQVPGKQNDRFGVITKSVKVEGPDGAVEYSNEFTLRFFGKRRMTDTGRGYIRCKVYAERSDEAMPEGDDTGCF